MRSCGLYRGRGWRREGEGQGEWKGTKETKETKETEGDEGGYKMKNEERKGGGWDTN